MCRHRRIASLGANARRESQEKNPLKILEIELGLCLVFGSTCFALSLFFFVVRCVPQPVHIHSAGFDNSETPHNADSSWK